MLYLFLYIKDRKKINNKEDWIVFFYIIYIINIINNIYSENINVINIVYI